MNNKPLSRLSQLLWQQLQGEPCDWLQTALTQLENSSQSDERFEQFLRYSAMIKRKVGDLALENAPFWQRDQVARLTLLSQLLHRQTPQEQAQTVKAAFKYGDESEQIAIIKGLTLLPCAGELVELAIATGRTNSLNLFAAIALNNEFAAEYYQPHAYHQLVLKTLFMDLDIRQMVGLKAHHCAELSALAIDLVNERLAAGRQPPGGIGLAIEPGHLNPTDLATFNRLLR